MSFSAILGVLLALSGGILFYFGFRKSNESNNLATYVPTDDVTSIPFGVPVIVSGIVTADQPLISPVTQKPCVYYNYVLERETENKDDKGNTSWEWKTVGSPEKQTIPFYLQDKKGKLLIKPDNCEINGIYHTQQFLQPGTIQNNTSTGMKLFTAILQASNAVRGNRERVTENTIFTGSQLNVFGILTMEGEQKFIQKTSAYPLVLSPLSKDQLVGSERKTAYLLYALALILFLVGVFLLLQR